MTLVTSVKFTDGGGVFDAYYVDITIYGGFYYKFLTFYKNLSRCYFGVLHKSSIIRGGQ